MALLRLSLAFLVSVVSTLMLFGFMRFVIEGEGGTQGTPIPVEKVAHIRLVPSPEIEPIPDPTTKPVKPTPGPVVPVLFHVAPSHDDATILGPVDFRGEDEPTGIGPARPGDPFDPGREQGGDRTKAIDSGIPDREALPLVRIDPAYPQAAARRDLEGWVHLRFTIAADGSVVDAVVVEASDPVFEKSALQAVARWRYRPSMRGGEAVEASNQQVLLRFRRPA